MSKIYFDVGWDQSGEAFLDDILKLTPDRSGTWGEVTAVREPSQAEYHIVFNQPTYRGPDADRLLFCMEPPCTTACNGWGDVESVASYPLSEHPKPQSWHVLRSYDELNTMDPPTKSGDLSWVTTDKGRHVGSIARVARRLLRRLDVDEQRRQVLPLVNRGGTDAHVLRMSFYDHLVETDPELLDLYGRGDFSGSHYLGEIEDKWDGLAEYRYSLAIENYSGPNYFSEKLTDALLAWCMPIYWGCTNLEKYLPPDSFVRIDIENSDAPERVREIVNSDLREENLDAIAEARRRLLEEYQIWPTVARAIADLET